MHKPCSGIAVALLGVILPSQGLFAAENPSAGVKDTDWTTPTLVTMHFENAPPKKVFEELVRQCHGPLMVAEKGAMWRYRRFQPISLDADHQPFWNVMKVFCERSGIGIMEFDDQSLRLDAASNLLNGPTCIRGAAMTVAQGACESDGIRYTQDLRRTRKLSIKFAMFLEPKLRVLSRADGAILEQAVDAHGRSLVDRTADFLVQRESPSHAFSFDVGLCGVPQGVDKIAILKGKYQLVVVANSERLEFPDLFDAQHAAQSVRGAQVQIRTIRTVPFRRYCVNLDVRFDRPNTVGTARTSGLGWPQLVDKDGKVSANATSCKVTGPDQNADVEFNFDEVPNAGPPAKLVWDFPTAQKLIEIPFEFKDLPLP